MNRQLILAVSLGIIASVLIFRRRVEIIEGAETLIEEGYETIMRLTRGERNNNPGNIEKSSVHWQGEIAGSDSRFATFSDSVYGIRALAKLLQNYAAKYGLNTIRGIINRYAPSSENDSGAYIAHVSQLMNVSPDVSLDLNDPELLHALVSAIITHENGRLIYSAEQIANGIAMV